MFSNFYKNDIYFLKLFKYINFRKLYEKITLNYLTVKTHQSRDEAFMPIRKPHLSKIHKHSLYQPWL